MSSRKLIASLDDYPGDGLYEISRGEEFGHDDQLLLIINKGKPHLIENKCGHFGVSFVDEGKVKGKLRDNEIICAEHGISFDLDTGEIVNRPYENCNPIKVFAIEQINNQIYLIKTSK